MVERWISVSQIRVCCGERERGITSSGVSPNRGCGLSKTVDGDPVAWGMCA
jgi:hypothetical protein